MRAEGSREINLSSSRQGIKKKKKTFRSMRMNSARRLHCFYVSYKLCGFKSLWEVKRRLSPVRGGALVPTTSTNSASTSRSAVVKAPHNITAEKLRVYSSGGRQPCMPKSIPILQSRITHLS